MEIYLTIDEYMDTFLALLTFSATVGSLCYVRKGFKLAKAYLEQHQEKLDLEQFYKVRAELYFCLQGLKADVLFVLNFEIEEVEVRVWTEEQNRYYSEGHWFTTPYLLERCPIIQQVEILYGRLKLKKQSIASQIKKINELTLFIPGKDQRYGNLRDKFFQINDSIDAWVNSENILGDFSAPLIKLIAGGHLTVDSFNANERYYSFKDAQFDENTHPYLLEIRSLFPVPTRSESIGWTYNNFLTHVEDFSNQLLGKK